MRVSCWPQVLLVSSIVLKCACSFGYSDTPKKGSDAMERLISASNTFGFNVFHWLVERNSDENIFISPTSLEIALSMTYNGAGGKTQETMAKVLEIQGMSLNEVNQANAMLMQRLGNLDQDILLDMANSLWAREGEKFKLDFLKRNEEFYGADLRHLDFDDPKAPSVINDWVKEKTQGKIEEIEHEILSGVILYLINAVYFKGRWTVMFDEKYTGERDFTLLDGSKKKVAMMMTESRRFKYLAGKSFDAVGLPYGAGKMSMYIFVPHRGSSLKEFCEELTAGNWDNWMSQFQQPGLTVVMPRFKLEYDVKISDALIALGMGIAFEPDAADFSGMCSGRIWIDEVKQKTYLEVNEEGTEAAAATSVKMKKGGRPMHVDRPFFFAIRDNETGAMLFMGSVVEP